MDDLTTAAIAAVTEMKAALSKFEAVITKCRSNFEGDLINPMDFEQVSEYNALKYPREQKPKKTDFANIDEPF